MKIFTNMKLRTKVLLMALIPVMAMCIIAITINNTVVEDALLRETQNELKATAEAVLAAYDQNAGDYFVNSSGDVWKGAYNVSLSETLIDEIAEKTGMAVTFFYEDQRLVTSLKDKEGARLTGSPAGEFLVKNVLEDGNDVFTNRVSVEGTMYYGYYIPVLQNNSDEVIGMVFSGMPVSVVSKNINLITKVFVIAIAVILLLTVIVCSFAANGISKNIKQSIDVVREIANGNLHVAINEKSLRRRDEVGALSVSTLALSESLSGIMGAISNNAMNLNTSSQEMNVAAGRANEEMDTINANLRQILEGAKAQTDSTQHVTDSVGMMNAMLEDTSGEVVRLQQSATAMTDSSEDVMSSLNLLNQTNHSVLEAVERIQKQTIQTDHSVEKIKSAVDLITDIAEETNLLSLNASIEAARAGETGKGFAVVAQQISKLAEQSNSASTEISEMVAVLGTNSENTIETMETVQNVINRQSSNVQNTRDVFIKVEENIRYVAEGIKNIEQATSKLNQETDAITKDIHDLESIALENESDAEATLQSGENVLGVVSNVNNMSEEVRASANDMTDAVSKFHL